MQKMSMEKLKELYHGDDVVMGDILAQNWANGDEFSWNCGGLEEESVSLVEGARKMKL